MLPCSEDTNMQRIADSNSESKKEFLKDEKPQTKRNDRHLLLTVQFYATARYQAIEQLPPTELFLPVS